MTTTKDILVGALRLCRVAEAGEDPDTEDIALSLDVLNNMVTGWQNDHTFTWKQEEILIPTTGLQSYKLGPDGTVKYSGVVANVKEFAPSGQTHLIVDSTEDMVAGQPYNVGSNSGNVTAVVDSTRIDIDALTIDVTVNSKVRVNGITVPKPLRLYDANYFNGSTEIPINTVSREEYRDFPNKNNVGTPNQVFYDRQLRNGILSAWPVSSTGEIRIMADLPFVEIDIADIDEEIPFPANWNRALKYNLAVNLDGYYDLGLSDLTIAVAAGSYEDVTGEDTEGSDSIFIGSGNQFWGSEY